MKTTNFFYEKSNFKEFVSNISYDNLNSIDAEPTAQSLEWDASVDTYADLTYINTKDISGTVFPKTMLKVKISSTGEF